jgi:hypothetical protein
MEECPICYYVFKPSDYHAMLQNESGKYHLKCLYNWLRTRKAGILTQNVPTTYTIYDKNVPVITKDVNNLDLLNTGNSTTTPKPIDDPHCNLF